MLRCKFEFYEWNLFMRETKIGFSPRRRRSIRPKSATGCNYVLQLEVCFIRPFTTVVRVLLYCTFLGFGDCSVGGKGGGYSGLLVLKLNRKVSLTTFVVHLFIILDSQGEGCLDISVRLCTFRDR